MPRIVLPDVSEIVEAVQDGVERRLGRRRSLYTGEDLIEDVGLSPDQFGQLVGDLERRFSVAIDPENLDHVSIAGALVVRLLHMCSRAADLEDPARAVA